MKKFERIDLGLKEAYDELFMNDEERKINRSPRVLDIEIESIDDFEGHPFKVKDDEEMERLMESISTYGVLTPVMIREKDDGRYEMISGHRRKRACERLGLATVPAVIKELSREEAIIAMTDSNIQRENILPSEKAWAYKMKMDAINKQGKRSHPTSRPLGEKLWSVSEISKSTTDSERQIHRYIRLTYLIPELLQMVDDGRIAFRPAVDISYLTENEQHNLYDTIVREDCTPSLTQTLMMKKLSAENNLNPDKMLSIMSQPKANQKEKISFDAEELRKYFPSKTDKQIKENILSLAKQYKAKADRNRDAR